MKGSTPTVSSGKPASLLQEGIGAEEWMGQRLTNCCRNSLRSLDCWVLGTPGVGSSTPGLSFSFCVRFSPDGTEPTLAERREKDF